MIIDSPAFVHEHPIPQKYTCKGKNVSPALNFHAVPNETKSLALIVDDPDAPNGTFVHWVVWNLSPSISGLTEGSPIVHQGTNDFNTVDYKGPCPPLGSTHRYFFKLYALDAILDLPNGSSKSELEEAMKGHVLAQSELMGTFQR